MRAIALAKKEFIQIIRDPRSLGLALAIPVLLVFLFGFALTLDVDNVPMVVWNRDKSQVSRDFILNFSNSRYFNIVRYCDGYKKMESLIDRSKVLMGMVIPKDFSKLIQSNQRAPVQFIVDGSDSNTARIAMGYLSNVVNAYNKNMEVKVLSETGVINPTTVDLRMRSWFNPNRESQDFVIPGNIAVIVMIISALLTSLTVAREWEKGTMEQLIATPVKPIELIVGKFAPYFTIGLIDLVISVTMGLVIFRVPFEGSIFLLFVLSCLFLTGALALGIFISIFAKTQLLATQIAIMATFMPTYLLSGFMFPIFNMPKAIQAITYLIPARYYIVILRGIYLKGIGIRSLFMQSVFLLIFACVMIALSIKRFKKKVV